MRALRSTSTAGGGQDFDTSFDTSDICPNNGEEVFDDNDDVVHILGGKSPLPPSKEQDALDEISR